MSAQVWAALIGGAAAGAVLTAITSLFTGWLSRRHDQRRWLLDKRLEAYFSFNEAVSAWEEKAIYGTKALARTLDARDIAAVLPILNQHLDRIALLAPEDTRAAARMVVDTVVKVMNLLPPEGGKWKDGEAARKLIVESATGVHDLLQLQRRDLQGHRELSRKRSER